MLIDPATGSSEPLPLSVSAGEALAYDEKTDTIYLSNENGVYISVQGAAFEKITEMPSEYVYGSGIVAGNGRYAFNGSGIWAMEFGGAGESGQGVQLTVKLHSSDPQLKTMFVQSHPEIMLNWQTDSEMTAADVADAIRSGDTETAVFSVRVDGNFGNLIQKGFAAPMSNPVIVDSVQRMYQTLAAPLRNDSGEIVAYPWDFGVNVWEVNQTLWDAYFPNTALPTTWKAFFTLMKEFELAEYENGDLFLMNWSYETMLERVLLSYIARQNRMGQTVNFSNPVLVDTIAELNKARELLLDKGIETYAEDEIYWDSEVVGEHSIFHYERASSTHSIFLWNEHALPAFTFAEGDAPAYTASMRVLVVNPNSPQKEQAEAFVALLADPAYDVTKDYIFHADAQQPYTQGKYQISALTIEKWQTEVSAIFLSGDDPLQTTAFTTQLSTLIERYAAGQMNAQMFLWQLNETAAMVENEGK